MITGAGRGIGLALSRRFLAGGFRVLACVRHPRTAESLREIRSGTAKLHILGLDVTKPHAIRELSSRLSEERIDILLNNAGVYGPDQQELDTVPDDARPWSKTFLVNVAAPFLICRAFTNQVARSSRKIMATMGSALGSLSGSNSGEPYIYRASKAAVHMVMKGLHEDLKNRGILSVALHPGWVRTSMGGPEAPMEAEESADALFRVLTSLEGKDGGLLLSYRGTVIPW